MVRHNNAKGSLTDLVSRLSLFNERDEYNGIVETAKKILSQSPNDKATYDSLIQAYIRHDKYSDLYAQLKNDPSKQQEYILEYGYALYKLDIHDQLVALVGDRKERGVLHLLAQSYYKQGQFLNAKNIYSKFINTPNHVDHEDYDLSVNERAIIAQLKFTHPSQVFTGNSTVISTSYDQLFNSALVHIAEGNYTKALDLLTEAKVLCQTTSYSSEDLAAELTPILVQASYANLKLSNVEQASNILNTIDYENLKDNALKYLINNLKLILDGDNVKNPFKALAFLESDGTFNSLKSNFVPIQQQILKNNKVLLEISAGKSLKNFLKAQGKADKLSVNKSIEGYSFLKEVEDLPRKDKIKELQKLYSQRKHNVALAFSIAQLYIQEDEYSLAATAIGDYVNNTSEISPNDAYAPGVVSALASLYTLAGKQGSQFSQIFESAVKHWSKVSPTILEGNPAFKSLFADAALALAGTGKDKLVRETLEALYKKDSSDVVVIAGLLGLGDAEITEKYGSHERQLLSIGDAVKGIDIEKLASSGLEPLLKKRSAPDSDRNTKGDNATKRKTKKPRLPKNYNPDKQPDPERWIPLRDRSTYKAPKAKGKKKVSTSTQGGLVDESLSVSSGSGSAGTSSTSSSSSSASKPKPKNIKKNNKKKGRR